MAKAAAVDFPRTQKSRRIAANSQSESSIFGTELICPTGKTNQQQFSGRVVQWI
jgi:hypothetical protein